MTEYMEAGRKTGRTSRMVDAAVEQARAGHHVFIVAANQREVVRINQLVAKSECERPEMVHVIASSNPRVDWADMRVYGIAPNELAFFDHYSVEVQHGAVLSAWSRFNLVPATFEEPAAEDTSKEPINEEEN